MASKPKKRIPKPTNISPTLLIVVDLKNPRMKPTKAIAIKNIEKEKEDNDTNKPVTVVPKNAPSITEKP